MSRPTFYTLAILEWVITAPSCTWRLWRGCELPLWPSVRISWWSIVAYGREPFSGPGAVQRFGRKMFRLPEEMWQ